MAALLRNKKQKYTYKWWRGVLRIPLGRRNTQLSLLHGSCMGIFVWPSCLQESQSVQTHAWRK